MSAPSAWGAKCPWMVQLEPTARLVPQSFANTHDDAPVPVTLMLAIESVAEPVLVMVTNADPLAVPIFMVGHERPVADSFTSGIAMPVPLRANDCGVPPPLSLMVTAAVNAPAAVGAKCPWIVQLAPAARLVPQLFANINEVASAPVTLMLVIGRASLPRLYMVTDADALADPTPVEMKGRE